MTTKLQYERACAIQGTLLQHCIGWDFMQYQSLWELAHDLNNRWFGKLFTTPNIRRKYKSVSSDKRYVIGDWGLRQLYPAILHGLKLLPIVELDRSPFSGAKFVMFDWYELNEADLKELMRNQ